MDQLTQTLMYKLCDCLITKCNVSSLLWDFPCRVCIYIEFCLSDLGTLLEMGRVFIACFDVLMLFGHSEVILVVDRMLRSSYQRTNTYLYR